MGAKGLSKYFYVIFPAALPSIITGMKLGWSFAWRSLMAGEMLFVSLGLGHLLMMGRELNDIRQIFAVMVVIVTIGIIVDNQLFGLLEKKIRVRWGLIPS
jgi:NitT/TauT family transport system permease protein